jgi:hypothetical protein
MISRLWHGWTTRANADAYEALLRREILPGIQRVKGFKGAHLLRRDGKDKDKDHDKDKDNDKDKDKDEVEFVTLTMFDSIEAVKEFAGEDYEVAVVPPAARKLLSRFDARSAHYQTVLEVRNKDFTVSAVPKR